LLLHDRGGGRDDETQLIKVRFLNQHSWYEVGQVGVIIGVASVLQGDTSKVSPANFLDTSYGFVKLI
jgi:hypothetical protein